MTSSTFEALPPFFQEEKSVSQKPFLFTKLEGVVEVAKKTLRPFNAVRPVLKFAKEGLRYFESPLQHGQPLNRALQVLAKTQGRVDLASTVCDFGDLLYPGSGEAYGDNTMLARMRFMKDKVDLASSLSTDPVSYLHEFEMINPPTENHQMVQDGIGRVFSFPLKLFSFVIATLVVTNAVEKLLSDRKKKLELQAKGRLSEKERETLSLLLAKPWENSLKVFESILLFISALLGGILLFTSAYPVIPFLIAFLTLFSAVLGARKML